MNRVLRFSTVVLGAVFLLLLFVSIRTMVINGVLLSEPNGAFDKKSFQYAFFLPSSDNSFLTGIKSGALEAAQAMNCAVIFHTLSPNSLSFEMAAYTGVNGVAVFSYEKNDRMAANLAKLQNRGIPIVQIENEVVTSPNSVLIGTNSYDSGKGIAKIAATSERSSLNLALIYSEKNPALRDDANLVEIGVKSVLGNRLARLYTEQTTFNPLDAEAVIYELLRRVPAIDIVALTDSNDTLVTIQAIIDLNLVGRVQIVGFGDEETITEYIDKRVVLGSIARNPNEIGYRAVMALTELNTRGNTSAYVNTGVHILTGKTEPRPGTGELNE